MNPYPLISIRVIALCFVLYGAFAFLGGLISYPLAMIQDRFMGSGQETLAPFNTSDLINIFWRSSPGFVGILLLAVSGPVARHILPEAKESAVIFATVVIRLVLLTLMGFVACAFLDRCFNVVAMMVQTHSIGILYKLVWDASRSLLPIIPLTAFWRLSGWTGSRIARL